MSYMRLLRTVRFLRPRQAVDQMLVRLWRRNRDPAQLLGRLQQDGEPPRPRWRPLTTWPVPDGTPHTADDLLRGRFSFVGHTEECGWPPAWDSTGPPRLWRYNLHYHGFLHALDYDPAREVVEDYLERHGPAKGAEGWEPYPVSLRLLNWLSLFLGRWREETLADRDFAARLWLEVRRMVRWLESHLERHLLANHLFENAVALSFAGACFAGTGSDENEANGWKSRGTRLLEAELEEQILADGGHYERSPMYQERLLYALGLLINTGDAELGELCREPAARMAGWLSAMTHPDGGIALFNDAALDVYPATSELLAWLAAMGVEPRREFDRGPGWAWLASSGYFTARNENSAALFVDAGEIGPDYQPGHAHADFLAIELSLHGRRFVVDGGVFDYEDSPERAWARGVRAHSTVFVDDAEPLELWGAFRVGRRGRPIDVVHESRTDGSHVLRAGHTGYRHLVGAPTPRREVTWTAGGIIHLRDRVLGEAALDCTSQLRIDGAWHLEHVAPERLRFRLGAATVWVLASDAIDIQPCRWFPRFGVEAPAHLLRQAMTAGHDPRPVEWVVCNDADLAAAEPLLGDRHGETTSGGIL